MRNLQQICKAELSYNNREKVVSVRYLAILLCHHVHHFRENNCQAYENWDICFSFWRFIFTFSRFISPLLLFRWIFVLLLSLMPWSWFIGLRKLRMTRLEATLAALFVHSIHSWRKFGLELEAFHEYGLFTQAYGMAILPLAGNLLISLIFLRVLRVQSTLCGRLTHLPIS